MLDAFAFFNLPRRPWLDAAELRDEFHRRSAALHPDAGGDADAFAQLNAAHQTLSDPASRLRHLLELESPEILAQSRQISPALAERFMRVGTARQAAAAFLAKHRAATSPLARALLAGEHAAQSHAIDTALADIEAAHAEALICLRDIDADWRARIPDLATLHAEFSYLGKWAAQLRDSRLQLALASNLKSEI